MRTRTLAAVAIATWSKTALVAPALVSPADAVAETPQPAPTVPPGCAGLPMSLLNRSETTPPMIWGSVWAKGSASACAPGTLTLQTTVDGAHWKTLASAHTSGDATSSFAYVQHSCVPGTWSYHMTYATDDRSFKTTSQAQQFTC